MIIIVKERILIRGNHFGYNGVRGYSSKADMKRAIAQLYKLGKANYFICFRDIQSIHALYYSVWEGNHLRIKW